MGRCTTLFLTDDDADDRLLMIDAINAIDPSIEIVEFQNGRELLTALQTGKATDGCLIILDMNMPIMNGFETFSILRTIPHLASIPTVMVSTSGNPDMMDFAKKLGVLNYYVKPNTMEGIMALCRQLLS